MIEHVEGGKLKRADILLAHSKDSYWGWSIRLGTRYYWNHASIVNMVRDRGQGYDEASIIDPKMGSIHIDNITSILRTQIGMMGLSRGWTENGFKMIVKWVGCPIVKQLATLPC
ncbi:hypothetical protein ACFLVX_01950 [Chloroflexota bacterium]